MSYKNCTEVSLACPVAATTYGYYPALGTNATLCAVFAALCIAQLVIGIPKRVYSYSIVVACGCAMEAIGYGGRIMMNKNPWNESAFEMQICCLVIAPSFIAAGIYLTVKHVVRSVGAEHSRIRPELYTWIFIGCDIGSIVLQAVGGGTAAAAGKTNTKMLQAGDDIIIAGIAFQVATMIVCGVLTTDFILRVFKGRRTGEKASSDGARTPTRERIFYCAVMFAYLTVLIRCIYRLPEMAGGWGNPRMRDEKDFLILDGLMVALASAALTIFHPALLYPRMVTGRRSRSRKDVSSSDDNENPVLEPTEPTK